MGRRGGVWGLVEIRKKRRVEDYNFLGEGVEGGQVGERGFHAEGGIGEGGISPDDTIGIKAYDLF